MTHQKCLHCASGMMEEVSYGKTVKMGRRSAHVDGLVKFVCGVCSGETVTRAQFNLNRQRVTEAIDAANAKIVTADFLRELRDRHQLSQRTASQLFGAGESSFAKWESEQTSISTPSSLLIRCAAEVPGVVEYLAELSGVTLEMSVVHSAQAVYETTSDSNSEAGKSCLVLQFGAKQSVEFVNDEKSALYNPIVYRGTRSRGLGIAK